jgi:hypothetical protein
VRNIKRYLKRSAFWKAFMFWVNVKLQECENPANLCNKDLNSEELTSESLHFKSYIKLDMKSLIESKNVGEDAVKEKECINIHKIHIYTYIYIYIHLFVERKHFNFSKW